MSHFGRIINKTSSDYTGTRGNIYLIGDGILDNFYFVSDKTKDLASNLGDCGFRVINYAVEEARLADMTSGIEPKEIYRLSRSYPYMMEPDNKVYPLRLLATTTKVNRSFNSAFGSIVPFGSKVDETIPDTVVLSIGGNDLRSSPSANIVFGVDYYVNAVMTREFLTQYEKIVEDILRRCNRIILLSIYTPYMGSGAIYALYSKVAMPVITKWRHGIEKIAQKYNLPVLDLGRTINNKRRDNYGSTDTSLSDLANRCISQCIEYIIDNYEGYNVYYAPDCDITQLKCDDKE